MEPLCYVILVFSVIGLVVLEVISYFKSLYPNKDLLFKEEVNIGDFIWMYEVNWEHLFNFPIERIMKVLHKEINKQTGYVFKIGSFETSVKLYVPEYFIYEAIVNFRETEFQKYSDVICIKEENGILNLARVIQQKEDISEKNSIIKAFWLFYYHTEKNYRQMLEKTLSSLYYEEKFVYAN